MWASESNLVPKFKDLCCSNRSPISLANDRAFKSETKVYVSFHLHITFSNGYWVISTQFLTLFAPDCVRKETVRRFFAVGQHEEDCKGTEMFGCPTLGPFTRLLPAFLLICLYFIFRFFTSQGLRSSSGGYAIWFFPRFCPSPPFSQPCSALDTCQNKSVP